MSASQPLLASSTPVLQGAEAKVYQADLTTEGPPVLLKHRFHKQYRHPNLDASLTRSRVAGEARALLKCLKYGVRVPGIRIVDINEGVLGLEWIEGSSVRKLVPSGAEAEEGGEESVALVNNNEDLLKEYGVSMDSLMMMIGKELAKMHKADIVHGDLTTSNMMLRHSSSLSSQKSEMNTELVLIDFGLAFQSSLVEDKAVDLYVLERAFISTHPNSERLFACVLDAYEREVGKDWADIRRRLDDVRLRGRKRSMVG
ncbi:hypothetical protein AMATHDRAFT_68501 [Amanita thiersii Skay4041]|uniref:EKC/KEOPS complex subunit BUD32 n=1 Tax=Amanita thiersii Skay4041 TaxID=703135 RepID=A0A2A9NFL2_9AGAR|nr:hypothetical protein AMATHDRAFT_68501 [Amanita thiersii Skay4041]